MILRKRTARLLVGVAAGALVVSACGSRSTGDTGSGSNPSGSSSSGSGASKVAKIGVIAPLTGDLSALGLGIKNSVDLAIKQANKDNKVKGWTLELDAQSDDAKPGPATNAATTLSSDPKVAAVVGTLNSSTAQIVQPILSQTHIAMVSPANTNPSLTQGADYLTNKKRAFDNYFRTATTDAVQGPFAAQYVYTTLGIKKAATINDNKAYGKGLVQTFETEFKRLGGTITSTQTINPDGDKNYSGVITKIKPSAPGLIYYGGEFPQAGPLSGQLAQAGLAVPLMGGDGIYDPKYIELGGRPMDLATSVGAPIESLASGKSFIDAYKAASYKEPYGAYGGYAYDAANAVIEALSTTLPGADSVQAARQDIVKALGSVSFDGVTGKVAFDEFGDATNKTLTVYKVSPEKKWVAEKTGTLAQ